VDKFDDTLLKGVKGRTRAKIPIIVTKEDWKRGSVLS
tara:strand:+ start:277 stop:387 length:111 start_codon:yes stop_codon:yes gene_type:complete